MMTVMSSPLVSAYLADLERALAAADPRQREEVLATIREHLEQALDPGASEEEVRGVLARMGSVESIAADVAPAPAAPQVVGTSGALFALGGAILGALLLVPLPFVAAPIALAALTGSILVLMRTRGRRTGIAAWVAVVVAGATLVMSGVMALTLLATGSGPEPAAEPVVTVTSTP